MSLRYAILGLLAREELSGYEITKRFGETVGYFWYARSQQIYPELARLEEDGLVTSRLVVQVGRPDKRLYRITAPGRERLRDWAVTPSPLTLVKDEFLVKVWSYGMVDPAAARRALAEHRAMHEERLARFRAMRERFPADADLHLLGETDFGGYLTLLAGIVMQEAFVDWCRDADRLFALREAAMPPATYPASASPSQAG